MLPFVVCCILKFVNKRSMLRSKIFCFILAQFIFNIFAAIGNLLCDAWFPNAVYLHVLLFGKKASTMLLAAFKSRAVNTLELNQLIEYGIHEHVQINKKKNNKTINTKLFAIEQLGNAFFFVLLIVQIIFLFLFIVGIHHNFLVFANAIAVNDRFLFCFFFFQCC